MYLIIGASGLLGSRVAERLLSTGQQVRVQSRDPGTKVADLASKGAEPVQGDLREDGWLDDAMRGVTRVLMSSQAVFPPSRTNHAGTVDGPGNKRVIDAAKRAGVEHIVFMSASMADPDFPVHFIRTKYATEQYLKPTGIPATFVRPPYFTEFHALRLLAQPLAEKGTVQFFGKGERPLRWISVEDVADFVVDAFRNPDKFSGVKVIGGPDVMSRRDALEVIERHAGREAKRRHIPLPLMRVMRVLTKPVNPGLSDLISSAIAEETLLDHPGFAPSSLDWEGPTTFEDVVRRWAGVSEPEPDAAD